MLPGARIVKKNAHPAIADEQDFWYAFNLLSATDFDGLPIDKPKRAVQYQQKNSPPNTALLRGTRLDGTPILISSKYPVYASTAQGYEVTYRIVNPSAQAGPTSDYQIASIKADDLDRIVSNRVLYWLEQYEKLQGAAASPLIDAVATAIPGTPEHPY